jgi:hypothetical protein
MIGLKGGILVKIPVGMFHQGTLDLEHKGAASTICKVCDALGYRVCEDEAAIRFDTGEDEEEVVLGLSRLLMLE